MPIIPPEVPGPAPGLPGHYAHHDWLTASVKALDTDVTALHAEVDQVEVALGQRTLGKAVSTNLSAASATFIDLPGLAFNFTVPPGGRLVKLTALVPSVSCSAAGGIPGLLIMLDGGQCTIGSIVLGSANLGAQVMAQGIFSLAAGPHTLGTKGTNLVAAGAATWRSEPLSPAFLLAEDIGTL